ncbi:MAG: dihydrolipoyllysine-residue acetyltransferase [Azoarcus sp.]|jgi:pyruvate dehydrogenase E2 component (dihydrolipoamide acetyltransferase)|nr:dihydrolipoyllysine-residue acetyltransferase [Azoarcus sp.]
MSLLTEIKVPDIGDFSDVPVIDIYVKPGDTVALDDALVTLESDKATMDVPATVVGVVKEVLVKPGDRVSEGSLLARVETGAARGAAVNLTPPAASASAPAPTPVRDTPAAVPVIVAPAAPSGGASLSLPPVPPLGSEIHASPSVRAYARELGADLARVTPSGPHGRILQEDVTAYIKDVLTNNAAPAAASSGGGFDLLPWPKIDFSKFGEINLQPLSRIQKISGQNLARNWVMIPAVTYHEDADITELEAFRLQINKENVSIHARDRATQHGRAYAPPVPDYPPEGGGFKPESVLDEKGGTKLTLLAFLIKASVRALQKFPAFNSSLDGDNLVLKKYFHIGFAADTPNGLVVPVIKNADKKGIAEIAAETGELARQAREGKLKPGDMQGACFTISSLGGIGGTYFSPIINAPEVAILGVNKSVTKPVWDGKAFQPRLILPLSLTADHRVIDGALATRFNVYLAQLLADFRRVAL